MPLRTSTSRRCVRCASSRSSHSARLRTVVAIYPTIAARKTSLRRLAAKALKVRNETGSPKRNTFLAPSFPFFLCLSSRFTPYCFVFGSLVADYFSVFQYIFKAPGDEIEYMVMWDYNVGLVRMTPFFKCCKYSKVNQPL